jgi:hypothetical protein
MDIYTREFDADDIVAFTQGAVNKSILQNLHARDLWFTPTEAPGQGRQRKYTYAHVMEAAICAELAQLHFPHGAARSVIRNRLRGVFDRGGGYVGDLENRIVDLDDLRDENCIWGILGAATIRFSGSASIADVLERFSVEAGPAVGVVLLDVGQIVKRMRAFFAEYRQ